MFSVHFQFPHKNRLGDKTPKSLLRCLHMQREYCYLLICASKKKLSYLCVWCETEQSVLPNENENFNMFFFCLCFCRSQERSLYHPSDGRQVHFLCVRVCLIQNGNEYWNSSVQFYLLPVIMHDILPQVFSIELLIQGRYNVLSSVGSGCIWVCWPAGCATRSISMN